MPIISIHTNLPKEAIPWGFEINLNKFLAPLFGKDLKVSLSFILNVRMILF
jgi:hypothetical protein